jgi:hypothetical protein
MTKLKLFGGVIALAVAAVFTFIFPGSGFEDAVVTVLVAIAGQFGLTSWRNSYDLAKGYLKSKTVVGAALTALPLVAIVALPLFGVIVPEYVNYVLTALVVAGAGTTLYGIFDVDKTTAK